MVKKLGIFALLMVLVGCSNVENQLKDTDNAVFSLDKSNTGRVFVLYPDKQKIKTSGTLVEGKLQGRYTEYYENGNLLLVTTYKDGKQNGYAKKYYPNGKVEIKGQMKNNLAEGKFTFFYEDGHRQSIKNFKKGIYDGYYMEFYPNGAVKVKGNYTDGFKNGIFSSYVGKSGK